MPRSKHNISKSDICNNALKVLNRLHKASHDAYLVGGSVRDLLLHKSPKDFDVVTDAKPNQIRKLFRNSRIIGRRFRLVHVLFHRDVIEVATYRSNTESQNTARHNQHGMIVQDNVYGTIYEDAWRRDFTINALYYDIAAYSILDFTGGFQDIQNKIIRIIGDPKLRYAEDPVRMLRALRFSAKLNFTLSDETKAPIAQMSNLLGNVSNARLFDEVIKLYHCGNAYKLHQLLKEHQLIDHLFPLLKNVNEESYPIESFINQALESTDKRIAENKTVTPAFLFAVILWFPLIDEAMKIEQEGYHPLPALEKAMSNVLRKQQQSTSIPKRFTQVMREIWLMQYRFPKRFGIRPYKLLDHPRFRAAYDFMLLRAIAGDEDIELAEWWTEFQEVEPQKQKKMIHAINKKKK